MTKWWDKYKKDNNKGKVILNHIAKEMIEMSEKLCDEFWLKERDIYIKYGKPGGSNNIGKAWRKRIGDLWDEENHMIHPLWVDVADIYDYLSSITKNG